MSDAVNAAATRLEQAVERLAAALARPPQAAGVTPDEVASLSARLDETLARLRAALADVEGEAASLPEDEAEPDEAAEPKAAPAAPVDDSSKGS
ncbi:hypothetical protein CR162_04235 [Pseudoroseomonas rhizosphaerae]|uniref:Uncharacterized protein n=2 Tax=Teichococcus rhizosphaerae TaxID=1335062 RepID=A0A2C6ZDI1_9PROT|nr:hypothetical protein CR162_04235 [Pseudoroseomonas rhizosphaerae]